MAAFIFLVRKAFQAKESNASLRYRYAMRRGDPVERTHEVLRRGVREILAIWIFAILPMTAVMEKLNFAGDETAIYWSIGACAVLAVPLWFIYRLLRFALGR